MKKNIFKTTRKQVANFIQEVNLMSNNGQVYTLAKKWETDVITHLPTIEIEVKGTHVSRPFVEQLKNRVPAIQFESVCMDADKLYVILSLRRESFKRPSATEETAETVAGTENTKGKETTDDCPQEIN